MGLELGVPVAQNNSLLASGLFQACAAFCVRVCLCVCVRERERACARKQAHVHTTCADYGHQATPRQTERQTERQTDRHTDTHTQHTHTQNDTQTHLCISVIPSRRHIYRCSYHACSRDQAARGGFLITNTRSDTAQAWTWQPADM